MNCKACGVDNKVGAVMCEDCGEVLEVQVAAATAPPAKPKTASVITGDQQVCRLVEGAKTPAKNEFELPSGDGDFEFLLGRTDLDAGNIPDVDLAKFGEKVTIEGKIGYTFSRKQALIRRFGRKLYLKALGSARTMFLRKTTKDWETLKPDEEIEISSGDRMRFGGTEGYIIFEIVEI